MGLAGSAETGGGTAGTSDPLPLQMPLPLSVTALPSMSRIHALQSAFFLAPNQLQPHSHCDRGAAARGDNEKVDECLDEDTGDESDEIDDSCTSENIIQPPLTMPMNPT